MKKICITCGREKDLSEFYKNKATHDGLYAKCKQCHTAYMRGHRKTPIASEQTEGKEARNGRITTQLGITESRGITIEQKRKYDLELELAGRKMRRENKGGIWVKAPRNYFYLGGVAML